MSNDREYRVGDRVRWSSDWERYNDPEYKVDPNAYKITGIIVGEARRKGFFKIRIEEPAELQGQVVEMHAWTVSNLDRPVVVEKIKLRRI